MSRLLLSLFLIPLWSFAAPVSGLKDNDTLLYYFSNTLTKDGYEEAKAAAPAICLYALKPGFSKKLSKLTAGRGSNSPCASFFLDDFMMAYEVVEEYPLSEVKEADWNTTDSNLMPKQLAFETKLRGKALNEAVQRLHAKCQKRNCADYLISFVAGREAVGTDLPLSYGFYFGPTAGFYGYNSESSFFMLNSNVIILEGAETLPSSHGTASD